MEERNANLERDVKKYEERQRIENEIARNFEEGDEARSRIR